MSPKHNLLACTIISFMLVCTPLLAQDFASWDNDSLVLKNSKIERTIVLGDEIYTERFFVPEYPVNFVRVDHPIPELDRNFKSVENSTQHIISKGANSEEFFFRLNDRPYNNRNRWIIDTIHQATDSLGGSGATLVLQGVEEESRSIEVSITYLLYPNLPIVRKKMKFRNTGKQDLKLEAVDVERLAIPWRETHNVVYADYGRQKRLGPFTGNPHDPIVASHDVSQRRGFLLGNEAPGVLKRTTCCLDGATLTLGLTHPDDDFAFRAWLSPGESWESPWVFTGLYHQADDPSRAIESHVNNFVRNHMGIRLSRINEKPVFVYNTWNPFKGNIDESMMMELANAAAECGIEEFIIDAGWYKTASGWKDPDDNWFNECGDWLIDDEKFPNGLKPVFDHIKSLGMKPGLWISLGQASLHSSVYKEHPEYWTKHKDGTNMFLHTTQDHINASACFSSGWPEYIKEIILKYVQEYGLEYAKLDLAVVSSPYHYDVKRSGCYARDHQHRDREESLLMNYRSLFSLFDELHEKAPGLFIDCTFETMGKLQLIDYAMCKHADGNWLSNFEESTPSGSLRIRQMSWWRSLAIPAASMVIGNPRMDDQNPVLFLKSLAGSLPIMLGDPRRLSEEERAGLKHWSDWLREAQNRHDYMLYRQDLPGFGEPSEGFWDGFQRINSETKSGGIAGAFRQGAAEQNRTVVINYLDPEKLYQVLEGPDNNIIAEMTGRKLAEKGFTIQLEKAYDGSLFEIRSLENITDN